MSSDDDAILKRLAGHDLAVYSAEWCPDCTRLKALLSRERIAHRLVDVEADSAAADRLVRETGKRAIPFILVDGGVWVRGYHKELPERLNPGLLLKELALAIDGPMKGKKA
jgi:glutaredoxin 3